MEFLTGPAPGAPAARSAPRGPAVPPPLPSAAREENDPQLAKHRQIWLVVGALLAPAALIGILVLAGGRSSDLKSYVGGSCGVDMAYARSVGTFRTPAGTEVYEAWQHPRVRGYITAHWRAAVASGNPDYVRCGS